MPRILIAEDSYALANLLKFVLSNAGFEVVHYASGELARDHGLREKFDVILLDQQMPRMLGLQVVEALRAEGENTETPIFLCTAKSHELRLQTQRSELRLSGVFTKPFSPRDLLSTLKDVLDTGESTSDASPDLRKKAPVPTYVSES